MSMRILCLVAYYLPGYKSGGPLRTIENMANRLGPEIEFQIITADRDLGDRQPYQDVGIDQWNRVDGAQVFYISPGASLLLRLIRLICTTPHDVLYLNSFTDPVFTIVPLLARLFGKLPQRPTVLAPRGELSEGALSVRWRKKLIYMFVTNMLGLYRALLWHASSDLEADEIRRTLDLHFPRVAGSIIVASDLTSTIAPAENIGEVGGSVAGGPLMICFLSRISPKKNLDFALRVLGRVKTAVVFDIYGPKEDAGYWKTCEALIKSVEHPVVVRYQGSVENHKVVKVLRNYDLFFFPTRGENFGHVIMESMNAGTPVLLSDTTPWQNLERLGVGWNLPLAGPDAFVSAILKVATMNATERAHWRTRVLEYANQLAQDSGVLEANRQLFRRAACLEGIDGATKASAQG